MKSVKQAFDAGTEEFAEHCLLHGALVGEMHYRDAKGYICHRYTLMLDGYECTFVKRGGNVIEMSYTGLTG